MLKTTKKPWISADILEALINHFPHHCTLLGSSETGQKIFKHQANCFTYHGQQVLLRAGGGGGGKYGNTSLRPSVLAMSTSITPEMSVRVVPDNQDFKEPTLKKKTDTDYNCKVNE